MVVITSLLIVTAWEQWDIGPISLREKLCDFQALPIATSSTHCSEERFFCPRPPAISTLQESPPRAASRGSREHFRHLFLQPRVTGGTCPALGCPSRPWGTRPWSQLLALSQSEGSSAITWPVQAIIPHPAALSPSWRLRVPFWSTMADSDEEGDSLRGTSCISVQLWVHVWQPGNSHCGERGGQEVLRPWEAEG